MYCLSLETSTKSFSLALSKDGKLLRTRTIAATKILEKSIIPSIDKLLNLAKVDLQAIDVLAIGLGPGSFTSLRVGLATVKALAHVKGMRVIGVSSLAIIAQGVLTEANKTVAVLVDARRGQVYQALFLADGKLLAKEVLLPFEEAMKNIKGNTLVVGDAINLYGQRIKDACPDVTFAPQEHWLPQAKYLAQLAHARIASNQFDEAITLLPNYLYADDCQAEAKK